MRRNPRFKKVEMWCVVSSAVRHADQLISRLSHGGGKAGQLVAEKVAHQPKSLWLVSQELARRGRFSGRCLAVPAIQAIDATHNQMTGKQDCKSDLAWLPSLDIACRR
jgi:hypothetical protein